MSRSRIVNFVFSFIIMMAFTSGCVSQSQHQDLVKNYNMLKDEKAAADKSCDENIEQLAAQLADFQSQNDELATRYAELNEKEAVFQQKSAEAEEMSVLLSRLQQDLAGQQAIVRQLEDTLKIEVVDKLMFKSGSARVTGTGSRILSRIAPILKSEAGKEVIVVGHTDDLPPSEKLAQKYPSNWELSAARAASIVHILTWQYKIDPARMTIQGAAHYHPLTVYDRKNKNYRKTNRVVEIILKPKAP